MMTMRQTRRHELGTPRLDRRRRFFLLGVSILSTLLACAHSAEASVRVTRVGAWYQSDIWSLDWDAPEDAFQDGSPNAPSSARSIGPHCAPQGALQGALHEARQGAPHEALQGAPHDASQSTPQVFSQAEDGPDGEPTQRWGGLYADLAMSQDWGLHLEWAGTSAEEGGGSLEFGDHHALSLLMHYQRPGASWRLQAGLRTGTGGHLDEGQLELARRLAEPLLAAPVPEPVTGLRLHAGAVVGYPAARGWDLLAAAGYDYHGDIEPEPETRITGGSVLAGHVGTRLYSEERELSVRLGLERADELDSNGITVREAHTGTTMSLAIAQRLGSLRLVLGGHWISTGDLQWPAAREYGQVVDEGPGVLMGSQFELGAHDGWQWNGSWRVVPALVYAHRRCSPEGLPYGEGWSAHLGPRLIAASEQVRLDLSVYWLDGRWKPYAQGGGSEWDELSGVRFRLEVATLLGEVGSRVPETTSR